MTEEGLVQLVDAVAWPLVTCLLVMILRAEIRAILARLAQLRVGTVEANFARQLEQVEQAAAADAFPTTSPPTTSPPTTLPPAAQPTGHDATRADTDRERIARLAAISPRAAVTESWLDVELATLDAARAAEIQVAGRIAGERVVEELVSRGLVAPRLFGVYRELRSMRNRAAHAGELEIGVDDAVRYSNLARVVASTLRATAPMHD